LLLGISVFDRKLAAIFTYFNTLFHKSNTHIPAYFSSKYVFSPGKTIPKSFDLEPVQLPGNFDAGF